MPTNDSDQGSKRPLVVSALCFLAVAVASWLVSLPAYFCWKMLGSTFGGKFADSSPPYQLFIVAPVGVFGVLWLMVYYWSRRKSVGGRCAAVLTLTALYLGLLIVCALIVYVGVLTRPSSFGA